MNEKIGLQDLAVLLAKKANITKKDAEIFVKESFNIMEEGFVKDKLLKIRNFGTFKLVHVGNRESVDVSTGERVIIPAHYKVTFSSDTDLAENINAPYVSLESVEIEENDFQGKADDEIDDDIENDYEFEEKFIKNYTEKNDGIQKSPEMNPISEETEHKDVTEDSHILSDDEEEDQGRSHKGFFWFLFLIASVLILFFAGYYFCPMINFEREKRIHPDSVLISSSMLEKVSIDSATTNKQKIDTATIQAADTAKDKSIQPPALVIQEVQKTNSQPSQTFVNKKYLVQEGNRLNTIALREYGHKVFWVYIYDENRNKISNPDLIAPGMTINIPPAEKYGIDKNNLESVEKAKALEQEYKH